MLLRDREGTEYECDVSDVEGAEPVGQIYPRNPTRHGHHARPHRVGGVEATAEVRTRAEDV
jgi:hypothetical protein